MAIETDYSQSDVETIKNKIWSIYRDDRKLENYKV